MHYTSAAAKKDLDAIKHFYFSGLKNLDIYKNFDGRTIGHIVRILWSVIHIYI